MRKWEKIDVIVIVLLSILETFGAHISSIIALIYCSLRVINNYEDSYYLILLFCANTNVFFISNVPVCNLVIAISLVIFLLKSHSTRIPQIALFLSFYELLHIFAYNGFNMLQSIVWCASVIFPMIFVSNMEKVDLQKGIRYFSFGVINSVIVGISFRIKKGFGFSINSFQVADNRRFGGGLYDANYFSMMCLLFVIIQFMIVSEDDKRDTKNAITRVGISIVVLLFAFMSLSRMFILALVITIISIVIALMKNNSKGIAHQSPFRFILPFFLVVIIILVFKGDKINQLLDTILNRFNSSNSKEIDISGGRIKLAMTALRYLINHPLSLLFGVGVQSYYERCGIQGYVHNSLLEILISFGMIGTVIFSKYYFYQMQVLNRQCKNEKHGNIAAVPLIITIFCMLSLNSVEVESFYALFSFLLALYCSRLKRKEKQW